MIHDSVLLFWATFRKKFRDRVVNVIGVYQGFYNEGDSQGCNFPKSAELADLRFNE